MLPEKTITTRKAAKRRSNKPPAEERTATLAVRPKPSSAAGPLTAEQSSTLTAGGTSTTTPLAIAPTSSIPIPNPTIAPTFALWSESPLQQAVRQAHTKLSTDMTQLLARAEKAGDESKVKKLTIEFVEMFEFVRKMPNCTEGNLEGFCVWALAFQQKLDALED